MQFYFPCFVFFVTAGICCLQICVTFIKAVKVCPEPCLHIRVQEPCTPRWPRASFKPWANSVPYSCCRWGWIQRKGWLVCWNKSEYGWTGHPLPSLGCCRCYQMVFMARAETCSSARLPGKHWTLLEGLTQKTRVGILVLTPSASCLFTNEPSLWQGNAVGSV